MIVKDAEGHLETTLESAGFVGFDEIVIVDTGSTDRTPEIAKAYASCFRSYTNYEPVMVDGKPVLSDFAAARDYARILSTSDYIFYLDSDDVIYNPKGLREWMDEFVRTGIHDGAFITYDYHHDRHGNCVMRHPTIRVAERLSHVWRSPIHEVLCCVFTPYKGTVPEDLARIVHDRPEEDLAGKAKRNAAVAEFWIKRLKESEIEPRLWYNYGKSLLDLERFDEALSCFQRYLDASGWNEEKYFCHLQCAAAHVGRGEYELAIQSGLSAVAINPEWRPAWLELGKTSLLSGDHEKALFYANQAIDRETRKKYQYNPIGEETGAQRILADAYIQLERYSDAVRECTKVLDANPFDEDIAVKRVVATNAMRRAEIIESYSKIEFMLTKENDPGKLSAFHSSIPESIADDVEFTPLLRVDESKRRIAFFCGESPESWGYDSHTRGIGGSETAVIHLSRELASLGWAVEVYGLPDLEQRGEHDGVLWVPWWRFRNVPAPDILVCWRTQGAVLWCPESRARYIWLHDVQNQNTWRPMFWEEADGVIFLSKAHRRTAPWIPDEKVWHSANGVDTAFCVDGENDPNRVIYASGPDRGLDLLLELWPRVLEARPNATLDVFYGFSPLFRQAMKSNCRYQEIYEKVIQGIRQPAVTWHGRVSQGELAAAFARSGIWAYPTSFPEISCITAMQAQVTGAIPVTSGYAALSETVKHGKVIGSATETLEGSPELTERWLESLIDLIGNERKQKAIRKDMLLWSRKNLLWSKIAQEWNHKFLSDLKSSSEKRAQKTELVLS